MGHLAHRRLCGGASRPCAAALLLLTACATAAAPSPPQARHPHPHTVTRSNPAGDAREPEDAALTRLLSLPAGLRFDRQRSLMALYPDVVNWRRVRVFGHPTYMAFRYGDDHYALDLVTYRPAEGDGSPEACLQAFVGRAEDEAQRYGAVIDPIEHGFGQAAQGRLPIEPIATTRLRLPAAVGLLSAPAAGPMPYVRVSGEITTLFRRSRYLGAVAAQESWPGTCLVHAFAVRVGTDEPLARKVVDRWVAELAPHLHWAPGLRAAPPFDDR